MFEWFKNLSDGNKIAIIVPVGVAVLGGIFGLFKLFEKPNVPTIQRETIDQEGSGHTAGNIDGDGNIIAGGDVSTGIDGGLSLRQLVSVSKEAGQSEEKIKNYEDKIAQLEQQLALRNITEGTGTQQIPQPSQEAKDLAAQIDDDDAPYARALKAIAEGNSEKADSLLDETQQFVDTVQQAKDAAQAKVYTARMQNAFYAGRLQDALQYCDKLTTLAGNDSLILNEIAGVYYENAKYKEADPLVKRALAILETSLGPEHPNTKTARRNLDDLK